MSNKGSHYLIFRTGIIVLGLGLFVSGCNKAEPSAQKRFLELQGTWQLLIRHYCEDSPIRSDILNLHSDGTFDQQTTFNDGRSIKSVGQHWSYREKDHIALDTRKRWDSDADPPDGIAEFEVLIVEFENPPIILLDPNSDCLYVKKQ